MNFKLSTLFWLVTLCAVIMGCWIWIYNERVSTARRIAESEANMAAMQQSLHHYLSIEMGKAHYFKRQLGVIDNSATLKESYIKLVRLPDELGGKQSHGLPFTWQWRMLLQEPDDFELCWAIYDIPSDSSFAIPEEHVHRSHLNIIGGTSQMGDSHFLNDLASETSAAQWCDQPLEVIVYFRIDGDSEGGTVHINYEICKPSEPRLGPTLWRGERIDLKSDEIQWLRNCRFARGGYGDITGRGIEHNYQQLPLLHQTFSLDVPLTLVKIRTANQIGLNKYEPFPGPCLGLQVWIQKKSGPATDRTRIVYYPRAKKQ